MDGVTVKCCSVTEKIEKRILYKSEVESKQLEKFSLYSTFQIKEIYIDVFMRHNGIFRLYDRHAGKKCEKIILESKSKHRDRHPVRVRGTKFI